MPVFKLSELLKMYTNRLKELGVDITRRIHSTRLKHRILSQFEDLKSYNEGREVYLAFDTDIGAALRTATNFDYDDEAFILSKAANIIRRDIFNDKDKSEFDGTFSEKCQQDYVPSSLKTLIGMLLGCSNINDSAHNRSFLQAQLSISQLVIFNSHIKRRKTSTSAYHSRHREPPLSIYIGSLLHAKTRKRGLIDKLYELGMSVSYDRVLEISTDLGNGICAQYEAERVVCPPSLKKELFTTAAVDNIDHNPSSTTCKTSFHGTGISLFQHVNLDDTGVPRNITTINKELRNQKLKTLPEEYTNIAPAYLPKNLLNLLKKLILPPDLYVKLKEKHTENR